MIIDPRRSGCTIWFINKSKMQFLNGNYEECINRIYNFVIKTVTDEETKEEKKIQLYPIKLDTSGTIGKLYSDIFKQRGIEFEAIKIVMDIL